MFLLLDVADFKIFQISNFLASQFCVRIARVVETERHLFLGKQIVILLPAAHIKLSTDEHVQFHHFSLLSSNLLLIPFIACCAAPTSHSVVGEADQILRVIDEPVINESKSDSEMESDVPVASSSSNMAVAKMKDKTTPKMVDC
jgi:hypothetical protein